MGRPSELTQAGVSEAVGIAESIFLVRSKASRKKPTFLKNSACCRCQATLSRVWIGNEGRKAASELVEDLHMPRSSLRARKSKSNLHNTTALLDLCATSIPLEPINCKFNPSQIKPHPSMVGICLLNIAWPFTKALSEPRGRMESLPRMSRPF